MPKTALERRWVHGWAGLTDLVVPNQAWGARYLWLGGHYDYTANFWKWNDGTKMPLETGNAWNCPTCWDTEPDQPQHVNDDKDEFAQQDFLGFLRWNGKWHDFHGKDQGLVEGERGDELSLGQQGICEAKAEYVPEPNGIDKYCCRMCNDVVILDTHCMPNEGCDKAAEEPYAFWGSRANCQRSCTVDPQCKYYLWRDDGSANARKTCATFKSCDEKTDFEDKFGDQIMKKVL